MRRIASCTVLMLALTASVAIASDPVGIYALIDKVVLEPNENAPERIQVWGAFAMAKRNNVNDYEPPERGYMYFTLRPGKEDVCKKEWADLKRIAGTRQSIGFASRWEAKGRVRKANEKLESPDIYPISYGLIKLRTDTNYPPIKSLLELPTN